MGNVTGYVNVTHRGRKEKQNKFDENIYFSFYKFLKWVFLAFYGTKI
jgi:hypothetical protein